MPASRPRTLEELLCGLDISCAGDAMRLVEDGLPSATRILNKEEVSEVNLGFFADGKFKVSDYFQDSEDEDYWSDQESEDSWYASTTEDEEDEEDPDGVVLVLVSPRSEASAPPASSLRSSTKRSSEESDTLHASAKRQRRNCEDSPEEGRPSTSCLSSSTGDRWWPDVSNSDED
ncbi:hypothetical protein ABVT39_009122 [Epinephelus coioides]